MVIQTPETAEFFSVEIPFPSSQAQDTKEKGSSHAHFDASGVYEVTLPDMTTEGALLPTYKCSSDDSCEFSSEIRYPELTWFLQLVRESSMPSKLSASAKDCSRPRTGPACRFRLSDSADL